MKAAMEYSHWGIWVSCFNKYGQQIGNQFFAYPVGARGPIDSPAVEQAAMAYCRANGGEPKGPFFKWRPANGL